jgi:hypothetical protein
MNILEELKLSKKQNNNKRYDYLCKQFNVVNYAMKLEKYTIKLQQENKQLDEAITIYDILVKSNIEENIRLRKIITRVLKYIDSQTCNMPRNGCSQRLSRIKKMLKEASE